MRQIAGWIALVVGLITLFYNPKRLKLQDLKSRHSSSDAVVYHSDQRSDASDGSTDARTANRGPASVSDSLTEEQLLTGLDEMAIQEAKSLCLKKGDLFRAEIEKFAPAVFWAPKPGSSEETPGSKYDRVSNLAFKESEHWQAKGSVVVNGVRVDIEMVGRPSFSGSDEQGNWFFPPRYSVLIQAGELKWSPGYFAGTTFLKDGRFYYDIALYESAVLGDKLTSLLVPVPDVEQVNGSVFALPVGSEKWVQGTLRWMPTSEDYRSQRDRDLAAIRQDASATGPLQIVRPNAPLPEGMPFRDLFLTSEMASITRACRQRAQNFFARTFAQIASDQDVDSSIWERLIKMKHQMFRQSELRLAEAAFESGIHKYQVKIYAENAEEGGCLRLHAFARHEEKAWSSVYGNHCLYGSYFKGGRPYSSFETYPDQDQLEAFLVSFPTQTQGELIFWQEERAPHQTVPIRWRPSTLEDLQEFQESVWQSSGGGGSGGGAGYSSVSN